MTPYEIVELRLNIIDKISQSFQWWISITFAALVTAYVVGLDLAGVPSLIIIGLYIISSFNNILMRFSYLKADAVLIEKVCDVFFSWTNKTERYQDPHFCL